MNLSFSSEPALYISVINALLILGATFGLPLSPEQKGALDAALAALAGVVIRSQVSPTKTVRKLTTAARARRRVPTMVSTIGTTGEVTNAPGGTP